MTSDGELITPAQEQSLPAPVEQQLHFAKRRGLDDVLQPELIQTLDAMTSQSTEPQAKKLKFDVDGSEQSLTSENGRKPRKVVNFLRAPSPTAHEVSQVDVADGEREAVVTNSGNYGRSCFLAFFP